MDRTTPIAHNEEIELYIRTYYSLLRSSGPIRVRSLEETHIATNSNLHQQAGGTDIDVSALIYCALRLPECIADANLMVMGQMEHVFRREGYPVEEWQPVKARARRRKLYFAPEEGILAAFVASVSDIDDLIPCLTTYQIEWNKLNQKLSNNGLGKLLAEYQQSDEFIPLEGIEQIRQALDLESHDFARLCQLWPGRKMIQTLSRIAERRLDLRIRVLGSGLSDYRRSVNHWWNKIEDASQKIGLCERPIYFVSSNIHSLVNLVTGTAQALQDELLRFVEVENPEDLWKEYQSISSEDHGSLANFFYYVQRIYLSNPACPKKLRTNARQRERKAGIMRVTDPHCLDVEAQVIEISAMRPKRLDPRLLTLNDEALSDEEWALLKKSDALIFNIDYPLGMAAYHIFSQVSSSVSPILGVYILGKAATLNGRVGDVMIPNVVYDEHSRNSYLFRNCFTAQNVAPYLQFGTVFDNQKAVTVRGTVLQNREFMHVFYEEGYTDIEMEAGPYLSSLYEDIYPKRFPADEIVNLFINAPYDVGLLHYASDTPISRRQTLLSKSMSYFGVDATYATSIAVLRRILQQEIARLNKQR